MTRSYYSLMLQIIREQERLSKLAQEYGLHDRRVLKASQALDRLIVEAQRGMCA